MLSPDFDDIKDFSQLGQYLKSIREERNISIEEIHKETKIRKRYLDAIENGEFSIIPGGDVYVKGFLRNYSICIGIEPSSIIDLYNKLKGESKEKEEEKEEASYSNSDTVKMNVAPSKFSTIIGQNYKKILAVALSCLLILALIISIRSFLERPPAGENVSTPAESPVTQEPPPEEMIDKSPKEESPVAEEEKNVSVEIVEDNGRNTVYIIDDEHIEVALDDITGRCWISVQKDGQQDFEGILNPGDSKSWEAGESLKIRIGNPPVVKLVVNGNDMGRPREGARDFIFKKRT